MIFKLWQTFDAIFNKFLSLFTKTLIILSPLEIILNLDHSWQYMEKCPSLEMPQKSEFMNPSVDRIER